LKSLLVILNLNDLEQSLMPNANITKRAIANTMKQLMEKIPFDRITTADIINKCGISRKTFYYHFQDKYDVVNWIFSNEIVDGILDSSTLDNWMDGSIKLCCYIRENKTFYTNAVNANGQNCFIKFLHSLTEMQLNKLCKDALEKQILSEDDFNFLIEFYYHAFIGVFTIWVKNDMKDSPEVIVNRWTGVVDKSLEHYIHYMREISDGKVIQSP
jgi:probable dihydroxyacetone kinase regulator